MIRSLGLAYGSSAVRRHPMSRGLVVVVTAVCAFALAPVGVAQASTVVALWNMNELPGSTVLVDSGPNHLNGTIGTSITLNGSYHSFPVVKRGTGGTVDPQHLDVVKSALLNPGTSDFIVTMRVKVLNQYGNVMQKGQSGSATGYWKVQLDGGNGRIECAFISPTGKGAIRNPINVIDGNWHIVTCERGPGFVSTTVDGVTARINHTVGNLVNNNPLTIGGKLNCDATLSHECDYFIGQLDYVEVLTR